MNEFQTKLMSMELIGIVEDNIDPDKQQRIKIRIPYLHGSKDDIPTESLPWAHPQRDLSGIVFSIPEVDKVISVRFPDGNPYFPIYNRVEHLNINLQKKIEKYAGEDYVKFISFCYNYNTQIFVDHEELNIIHNNSGLIIDESGNIVQRLADKSTTYKIGDGNATQQMVLGTIFFQWFDKFIATLPTAYLGNLSVPVVPNGPLLNIIAEYNSIKLQFLSDNAFINANNTIIKNRDYKSNIKQTGDKYEFLDKSIDSSVTVKEISDIEQEEKEQLNEDIKEQKSEEIKDEAINAIDGKTDADILKNIKEQSKIIVDVVEPSTEEANVELSEAELLEMDNKLNNPEEIDFDETTLIQPDTSIYEENYEFNFGEDNPVEPFKNPPASPPSQTSGSSYDAGQKGSKNNYTPINYNKEDIDLSVLKKNENGDYLLSKYLVYKDAIYSNSARQRGIDNRPDNNTHLKNLQEIGVKYFDTTFSFFKVNTEYTLVLNSAYRNLETNTAVGGAKKSQHKSGSALDLKLVDKNGKYKNNLLFYFLKHKFNYYGQLIWEDNNGDGPQWCHISLNNQGITRSVFTAVGGVMKAPNEETLKILKENNIWDNKKDNFKDKNNIT